MVKDDFAIARGGRRLIVPSRLMQLSHDATVVYLQCICGCGLSFRDEDGERVGSTPGKYHRDCAERKKKALENVVLDFNEVRR
jgi:predicted adenine nucleotide alpha hydrolase (AANH) superfamily ATPase